VTRRVTFAGRDAIRMSHALHHQQGWGPGLHKGAIFSLPPSLSSFSSSCSCCAHSWKPSKRVLIPGSHRRECSFLEAIEESAHSFYRRECSFLLPRRGSRRGSQIQRFQQLFASDCMNKRQSASDSANHHHSTLLRMWRRSSSTTA